MSLRKPARNKFGASVPTTFIWDIAIINGLNLPKEFKDLLIRLYQNLGLMASVLNVKDTGYYPLSEFVTSQHLFSNPLYSSATAQQAGQRPILRTTINFGPLPNTGTTSVPHHINCTAATLFVKIYGAASDQVGLNYIPIPYASASGTTNIELSVDATNVTIITASNRSNFNQCLVVLEYVQS